ncbi:hypothetical protein [Paludisphaera rhizosphaerae]|uniref:hypothetical protein n=1 Tax=Paludisphaera rhizosphaerae TaxID=2711216 RepID=UPI0013EA9152|nr:hypothetical protein [Paludisphaera rhizosphaerae]
MRRQLIGAAALLITVPASSAWAQEYGGFGGEYVQAPTLYYPFPGVIESRFGTFFSAPVIPPIVAETPVEAATIDAANAAHEGVHPVQKAQADANAKADEDGADKPAGKTVEPASARRAARNKKPQRTYARGYEQAPAPFSRELPRGSLTDLNQLPAGVPTYSPFARYQTYGQAYGMGPYGSNYYSQYWHGYAPMNGYPAAAPLP